MPKATSGRRSARPRPNTRSKSQPGLLRAPRRFSGSLAVMLGVVFATAGAVVILKSFAATGTFPVVPNTDISVAALRGIANGTATSGNLFQAVDDGTVFSAADDDTTRVELPAGTLTGSHVTSFASAPAGTVTGVKVNYRAHQTKFASGTAQAFLYSGSTLIGTGAKRSLGRSYTNYSDSFTNLSVADPQQLQVKLELTNSARRGTVAYTMVWLDITYPPAATPTPSATASPTPTPAPGGISDLLSRQDLIYGSEIGAWRTNGKPAVDPATGIPDLVKAAKIPLIRFAQYDVFTDEVDPAGQPGTETRANFDAAIDGIRNNLGAEPFIKLLPITKDTISTKAGSLFCPAKSNLTQNLSYYKSIVKQAGSRVRLYESNNEMEYSCWAKWGFTSAGADGVSTLLGQHYAQNMPALKKYARSLGFEIATVGYIGVEGGTGWGDSITNPRTKSMREFMTAAHDAYVASGNDPDYIPNAVSIHAYPYSGDFSYTAPLQDIISYHDNWAAANRQLINSIWGPEIGGTIKLAISEWNAGNDAWSGFNDQRVIDFYNAWLPMLRRNGFWLADQFAIGSNGAQPYDIIKEDGTTRPHYNAFKAQSLADPVH